LAYLHVYLCFDIVHTLLVEDAVKEDVCVTDCWFAAG
jgi:hypothetical protein